MVDVFTVATGLQCLSAVCLVRTALEALGLDNDITSSVPFGGVSG